MHLKHAYLTMLLCLPTSASAIAGEPVRSGQALQVVMGLAIVLILIALASWAARRLQVFRPKGQGHLRLIEGMAIGARDKLLLVDVDGQRVLIGVSPGRMQALANLGPHADDVDFNTALDNSLPRTTATRDCGDEAVS